MGNDALKITVFTPGRLIRRFGRDTRGQSTVEAAFLIPIIMILVLLLLEPGILLYDRIVMEGAAAEGCRLLTTLSSDSSAEGEDYIRRRLSAIPQQDLFHVHSDSECSWDIELDGNETSSTVSVSISTEVKPLPLLDVTSTLLGLTNENGNFEVTVTSYLETQPAWVAESVEDSSPSTWIGAWT